MSKPPTDKTEAPVAAPSEGDLTLDKAKKIIELQAKELKDLQAEFDKGKQTNADHELHVTSLKGEIATKDKELARVYGEQALAGQVPNIDLIQSDNKNYKRGGSLSPWAFHERVSMAEAIGWEPSLLQNLAVNAMNRAFAQSRIGQGTDSGGHPAVNLLPPFDPSCGLNIVVFIDAPKESK